MKRIIWSCVGLVLGVLFVVGGILGMNEDTFTCGGKTMQEGDVCVSETRGGRVTENTLDETKTNGKIGAIIGIAMGGLVIVVSAQNLRIGIRQRRTDRNAAPAHPATPNPHWQPQPGQNWHHQPAQQFQPHQAHQPYPAAPQPQQQPGWHHQQWPNG